MADLLFLMQSYNQIEGFAEKLLYKSVINFFE